MNLHSENLAIIEKRWPAVYRLVCNAETPKSVHSESNAPQATLVIDGIHLSSAYDRLREAELQAALVPRDSREAWVYGLGLGDLPRVLLARDSIRKLYVCILNPAVTRQALKFFDHSDWLQDPRVILTVPDSDTDEVHFPFAAVSPCLQLADNRSARLRDILLLELSTPFIHKKHSSTNEAMAKRLEENKTFVAADGDAASLFGARKNSPIVVAAAGPTLSDHFAWLKEKRQQFFLVAVDAALKPLAEAGIYADVVLTVDMSLIGVERFFQGFSLAPFENTPLVYFPTAPAQVLNRWPGPRLTAYPDSDAYRSLSESHPKAILFSSGSVLHPAVDLAVRMGTGRIMLLGADFSFPGGLTHVNGNRVSHEPGMAAHWVINGRGERVETLANLRAYLRDLEGYIGRHPEIQFINGSKKGAHIKGARYEETLP